MWFSTEYKVFNHIKLKLSYCFPFFFVYLQLYFSQIARYFSINKATTILKNNCKTIKDLFLNSFYKTKP